MKTIVFEILMCICLTAKMQLLIGVVSAVVVSIAFPVRQHTDVVLALKQERRAVRAVGKAGGWKVRTRVRLACVLVIVSESSETLTTGRLICEIQTVGVAIAFEALSDAVTAAALEVSR